MTVTLPAQGIASEQDQEVAEIVKAFGVRDTSIKMDNGEEKESHARRAKTSQERIFLARQKPLQNSQSFELFRREIEKKIEDGFTF